jgi:hypothetical protein
VQEPPGTLMPPRRFRLGLCLLIGCAMAAVIGTAEPYLTVYMQSSYLFTDYHEGGAAFFVVALFLPLNVLLSRLYRSAALSAEELLFITAMMFASGSMVTSGGATHMVPILSSCYYYADSGNHWGDLLPYMPKWLSPLDPNGGTVAIREWWEGLPAGSMVPWGPWVRPLALWGVYLMAVWAVLTALMTLVRKQWMEHEHLSYPIAQVPAELCEAAAAPRGATSILRQRAFWLGLGLTFCLYSFWGFGHYFWHATGRLSIGAPIDFAPGYSLSINLNPVVMGLVFLVPNRIAFSVWTMALVSWFYRAFAATNLLSMTGNMPYGGPPETQHMVMGALVVFVGASLWYGRVHLWKAMRCALGLGERGYDRGEPASYRTALAALVIGCGVMLVWLHCSGLGFGCSVFYLLGFLLVYYAMARMIAQVGMPSVSAPVQSAPYMANLFGAANLGRTQIVALGYQFWNADLRNTPAVGTAHGMFLARRRYGLFGAMLLSMAVSYAAATFCVVSAGYRHGANTLNIWHIVNASRVPWWWATSLVNENAGFNYSGLAWSGFGAALMGLLVLAQRAFFWWPLHPVSLLIANTHMVIGFWFSIFSAWLAKLMLVGLAGDRAYGKARYFFIGIVMGGFLAGGVWAVVDMFTGSLYNSVFSI